MRNLPFTLERLRRFDSAFGIDVARNDKQVHLPAFSRNHMAITVQSDKFEQSERQRKFPTFAPTGKGDFVEEPSTLACAELSAHDPAD